MSFTYRAAERTNYFRVKDVEDFKKWAEALSLEVLEEDGRFALFPSELSDDGTFPSCHEAKAGQEEGDEFELADELAGFLAVGSVAVILRVAADKLRFLYGQAEAVDHTGKKVEIDLATIYELAAKELGGEVTRAEL